MKIFYPIICILLFCTFQQGNSGQREVFTFDGSKYSGMKKDFHVSIDEQHPVSAEQERILGSKKKPNRVNFLFNEKYQLIAHMIEQLYPTSASEPPEQNIDEFEEVIPKETGDFTTRSLACIELNSNFVADFINSTYETQQPKSLNRKQFRTMDEVVEAFQTENRILNNAASKTKTNAASKTKTFAHSNTRKLILTSTPSS